MYDSGAASSAVASFMGVYDANATLFETDARKPKER